MTCAPPTHTHIHVPPPRFLTSLKLMSWHPFLWHRLRLRGEIPAPWRLIVILFQCFYIYFLLSLLGVHVWQIEKICLDLCVCMCGVIPQDVTEAILFLSEPSKVCHLAISLCQVVFTSWGLLRSTTSNKHSPGVWEQRNSDGVMQNENIALERACVCSAFICYAACDPNLNVTSLENTLNVLISLSQSFRCCNKHNSFERVSAASSMLRLNYTALYLYMCIVNCSLVKGEVRAELSLKTKSRGKKDSVQKASCITLNMKYECICVLEIQKLCCGPVECWHAGSYHHTHVASFDSMVNKRTKVQTCPRGVWLTNQLLLIQK